MSTILLANVLLCRGYFVVEESYRRGGDDDPRRQDSVSSVSAVTAAPTNADGTSSGYSRRSRDVVSRQAGIVCVVSVVIVDLVAAAASASVGGRKTGRPIAVSVDVAVTLSSIVAGFRQPTIFR